jgi:hypothetical protein
MGYDMQWTKDGEDDGYFRANIWGMGTLRRAMDLAKLFSDEDEQITFPEAPEGVKHLDEYKDGEEIPPEVQKFWEAHDQTLKTPSKEAGKVHWAKFCSNDGWIVTTEEAKNIAEKLGGLLDLVDKGEHFEAEFASFDGREIFALDKSNVDRVKFIRQWVDYNKRVAEEKTEYAVW